MKQIKIIRPYPHHKENRDTVILRVGEVYNLDDKLANKLIKLNKYFW